MNDGCVFCKLVASDIRPGEDGEVLVIEDISPQAPVHALVIPAHHYATPEEFARDADPALVAKVFSTAAQVGAQRSKNGFRIVVNQGAEGGQTVGHVHVHVLAGRSMKWPPG